jgi:pimeloyl-ACP methyl ester carboxylesterase
MRDSTRRFIAQSVPLACIAIGILCLTVSARAGDSAPPSPATCRELALSVTLAADRPQPFRVVGTLCWRGVLGEQTVQLLVHGSTASRVYWDLPLQPQIYSYVRRATQAGFATFNLERIGIGASDRPPGADVTVTSNAFVAHQVVQALRDGRLAGVPFARVLGVGHSLGSRVLVRMQASFPQDLDGLILTGTLHDDSLELASVLRASAIPASSDPRFAGLQLPPGYLTLVNGLQLSFLVNPERADPQIVNFHESLKETTTVGELGEPRITDESRQLRLPVLLLVGEFDRVLCGNRVDCSDRQSILALESSFYAPETCLQLEIIRGSGHLFTLQRSPQGTYSTMLSWARRFVGVRNDHPSKNGCRLPNWHGD